MFVLQGKFFKTSQTIKEKKVEKLIMNEGEHNWLHLN
jgi:hypothetical protein